MGERRLEKFTNGFVAAYELLTRAGRNGFLVEYVCLATSVIDAMLRIGLVLQHQIKTQTDEIIDEAIYQGNDAKIISEREVYREALKECIIDEELYMQLNRLYDERNMVVHRYIISDVTTRQVLDIGIRYEKIIPVIREKIKRLEEKQIELGVGMTISGSEIAKSQLDEMSAKKHDDPNLTIGLS
jgi:uncharacterized protein YutE (UPF0331/DUF86 family)